MHQCREFREGWGNGAFGEGFMKEKSIWALVYMGRLVRRDNIVTNKRNSQVYLVKVLKCFILERS